MSEPGVSYAYISRIEAGTRQPSVKALRKLAVKLGVSAEYLETGSEISRGATRELKLADAELQLRLADDPSAAESDFAAVLDDARAAGDEQAARRARVGLALVAAALGRHEEAVARLEPEVEAGAIAPHERPELFATLGEAYAALGNAQAAATLFTRCLEDVRTRANSDLTLQARFANFLSFALIDIGEFDQARAVLQEVLERAETTQDAYMRVRAYWSLARLASREGRTGEALTNYRRAIGLLEATDDDLHLARAHIACASVLNDDKRAEEARRHAATAERLLGARPSLRDLAYVRTEQARAALIAGEFKTALMLAEESLQRLDGADAAEEGSAWTVVGWALANAGDVDAAAEAFETGAQRFEDARRWDDAARAYRACGKSLREAGRRDDALDALERAADAAAQRPSARAALLQPRRR